MKNARTDSGYLRLAVGLLVVALLTCGHWFYWYRATDREGRPDDRTLAGRLVLSAEGLPYRLWLPYPHQNLAALESRWIDLEALDRALNDLAGVELARLPSFGPFRLPPSAELFLASDEDRERMVIVMRMYPSIRWLLRAAGVVAGNEWLSGGAVEVGGRSLQVRWVDGNWTASSASEDLRVAASERVDREAHAVFRTEAFYDQVPAGLYGLRVQSDRIVIASATGRSDSGQSDGSRMPTMGSALIVGEFPGSTASSGTRALALFAPAADPEMKIPGATVVHRAGGERWPLPGENLFGIAGIEPRAITDERWTVWAYDDRSTGLGRDLIPRLEEFERIAEAEEIASAGAIDLQQARRATRAIDSILRSIPIVGQAEARRWARMSSTLEILSHYSTLSYRIGHLPDSVEVVIE